MAKVVEADAIVEELKVDKGKLQGDPSDKPSLNLSKFLRRV
jgi:hypothetical protein